jgi:hypothetical protein
MLNTEFILSFLLIVFAFLFILQTYMTRHDMYKLLEKFELLAEKAIATRNSTNAQEASFACGVIDSNKQILENARNAIEEELEKPKEEDYSQYAWISKPGDADVK